MAEPLSGVPEGLDLPEGCGVTRAEERFHQLGWLLFAGIILAALAGLLGPGPLSSRTAEAGPALSVRYDRFTRYHAPARLVVRARALPAAAGEIRLLVGRDFLEAVQIESIQPEPDAIEIGGAGHLYVFRAPRLGAGEATLVFHYRPGEKLRSIPIGIGIDGGPEIRVSQYVYP